MRKYEFNLTPAYCLYNGAAILEQKGAFIRFLIDDIKNEVLKGRLSRAFERHVGSIRKMKDCPLEFQNLIKIEFERASRERLRKCVSKLYGVDKNDFEKGGLENEEEFKEQKEAAAVLLLDSILNEARLLNATDIHIEKGCVRLRVNGRLENFMELQNEKCMELVQRIKLLAGLNVIEKRRCQDGSFVYGNNSPFFLRVSTMAVVGEKYFSEESLVIRLLDTSRIPLAADRLGFNSTQLEKLCGNGGLIHCPGGLLLVCGPTGSGKSTTIASLLVEIEKQAAGALKIISLEDPPEYVIPGVSQVKVDERNGFSDALNHIFRQDPDVIMIGEIRDEESAAAALRAALTGHLVFATLHAGSAGEAVLRLENLGLDYRLLCQVLRGIICQELNSLDGRMRLYSDISIPVEDFSEKILLLPAMSEEGLDNLMEHFTNFGDILGETMQEFKKQAKRKNRKLPLVPLYNVPLYKRRQDDAGIHQGAV